ncbi:MAG: TPM domain-containing protein [Bacteroidales bacterium]
MKKINLKPALAILVLTFLPVLNCISQDFPEKPVPPRLVNDFAGMLTPGEADALERKLDAYNDSTSTQIAIVIVPDLHGYAPGDYAQRLAEKWGIGQKGKNNGVLILVKPKTSENSRGDVFIAPGYGLEGAIPDIMCGEIIDKEIVPAFKAEKYYEGLDKATSVLMSLASGEFPPGYGKHKGKEAGSIVPFIVVLVIIVIILFSKSNSGGSNQRHIGHKGLPLWMLLTMMNSGRNAHSGSWGGFSGGGGFGGGGGGFGGFGGGSFGGGGAGGSW